MLEELAGKLVEVVGQVDLAAERSKRLGHRTASLHCDDPRDRTPGSLDHHLFAALGELDQARELALGLVHANFDHAKMLSRLS